MFFWNRPLAGEAIALLAGKGDLPVLFAKAAQSLSKKVIVVGIEGVTDMGIARYAERAHFVPLETIGEIETVLKNSGVKHAVLAGGIPKNEIYNPKLRSDALVSRLVKSGTNKGDDHLLRAFEIFLKVKCGVSVIDPRFFLKEMLATKGVLTKRVPTAEEWRDLKFGWQIARGVGKMDIGQTVAVRDGIVLAVEALEGTDSTIRRAGELARGGAVVVKTAKPNQDLRFDLPCVGPETIESLRAASSRVLGIEAGKTLILFKKEFIETADREGLTVVGI